MFTLSTRKTLKDLPTSESPYFFLDFYVCLGTVLTCHRASLAAWCLEPSTRVTWLLFLFTAP